MEARIPVAELIGHRRMLKAVRPRHLKLTSITLTVSDQFLVSGPGFQHALICEPVQWGGLVVPFAQWCNFVNGLSIFSGWLLTVAGERGFLRLGPTEVRGRRIVETGGDRLAFAVPLDPSPSDVLKAAARSPVRDLQRSSFGPLAASAARRLQNQLTWAAEGLSEYGVTGDDLAPAVGRALAIGPERDFHLLLSLLAALGK